MCHYGISESSFWVLQRFSQNQYNPHPSEMGIKIQNDDNNDNDDNDELLVIESVEGIVEEVTHLLYKCQQIQRFLQVCLFA